jgi:hypothetical protein
MILSLLTLLCEHQDEQPTDYHVQQEHLAGEVPLAGGL